VTLTGRYRSRFYTANFLVAALPLRGSHGGEFDSS
jgi:hypothetical protein